MDIKKTISSTTVQGSKDSEGRDFRTQLNIALYKVCSQAGFDVQKDADNKNVTATLPWGTVLSINDLPVAPFSNSLEDQVILVWSEQLKVAYIAFLNSLVNGENPTSSLQSFGLLWVVGDKKQGIPGSATSYKATLANMAMIDTVGSGVPNILVPLYFSYAATGTLKGACFAVLFFHEPRAHPSRDDSHGRGDRFLFLRELHLHQGGRKMNENDENSDMYGSTTTYGLPLYADDTPADLRDGYNRAMVMIDRLIHQLETLIRETKGANQ